VRITIVNKFLIGFLAASIAVSTATISTAAPASQPTFTDIDQSYAKDAINQLVEQGIVNGVDEKHFNPQGSLTRAEFVAILVRALRLPIDSSATSSSEFTDVQGWAVPYIASARHAGIIEGVGKDLFDPDGLLTREQAAKLLVSALNHSKPDLVVDEQAFPSFEDSMLISEWSRPYVAMAAEHGLVSGRPDGTFDPRSYANREMAAVMCVNFLDALGIGQGNGPVEPTSPNETVKLPAPTNFTSTGLDGTSMSFTWNPPANSAGIAGYDIFMGLDRNKIGSTTTTSFTVKNLDPNLVYSLFYVKSRDTQGRLSERSNEYVYTTSDSTNLVFSPSFGTSDENKTRQVELYITGDITQSDARSNARLYGSFDNLTSKDITFGPSTKLGVPEIIQEGSGSLPLIVAWGPPEGFKLSAYLQYSSYLNMNVQFPMTIHSTVTPRAQFELRTVEVVPSTLLLSQNYLLMEFKPQVPNEFDIRVELGQPQPAQSNQQITIPVTIKGKVKSEYLSDLAALQVRILDGGQVLNPPDVLIEDVDRFGHGNIEFNGTEFLIIQFDKHHKLADLQQELETGITFNLNVTLRKPGNFAMFATLNRVDDNRKNKGSINSGNAIQLTVQ
jgi:hypothetical protein